mgnify:CR=1 FL=1
MPSTARPVLNLPRSRWEWGLEVAAITGLLLGPLVLLFYWPYLGERVPVHFDSTGQPTRHGSPLELLVLPVVAGVMYALMTALARIPHWHNYPVRVTERNAERLYRIGRELLAVIKAITAWMCAAIAWVAADAGASGGPPARVLGGVAVVARPFRRGAGDVLRMARGR